MIDLVENKARAGDIRVSSSGGQREKIELSWKPQHKALVVEYAGRRGWNYNFLAERALREHVEKESKRRGWKKIDDTKAILIRLSGAQALAGYVRGVILEYIDNHPLKTLPPPPTQTNLDLLKETRPEALVYVVPICGCRIVAAPDGDGGWRGLVFDPSIAGSVSTWHSSNLAPPVWAKTPTVLKALALVASRIDMDDRCYFDLPQTKIKLAAILDPVTRRFESGQVIDTSTKKRQDWLRGGWYANMPDREGPFNLRPNVRRALNMLCRTTTVGDGGLTAPVPSN